MNALNRRPEVVSRGLTLGADLDTLLSDRDHINGELKGVIDAPTEEWGIHIDRVEVKDISLPESMRRSMTL